MSVSAALRSIRATYFGRGCAGQAHSSGGAGALREARSSGGAGALREARSSDGAGDVAGGALVRWKRSVAGEKAADRVPNAAARDIGDVLSRRYRCGDECRSEHSWAASV